MNSRIKRVATTLGIVLAALIVEFAVLEETIGIGLPSDRHSASSSVEIALKAREPHFITRNVRFSVIESFSDRGSATVPLVLRESFFVDREVNREGPPEATVTVEAMNAGVVIWTLQEIGERGDVIDNRLYRVTVFGCFGSPNTYSYFSLLDGRKIHTGRVELSTNELAAFEQSIVK